MQTEFYIKEDRVRILTLSKNINMFELVKLIVKFGHYR